MASSRKGSLHCTNSPRCWAIWSAALSAWGLTRTPTLCRILAGSLIQCDTESMEKKRRNLHDRIKSNTHLTIIVALRQPIIVV